MTNVKNKNNFGLFFIIFLTSFLLGVIFSFYIGKNINKDLLKNIKNSGMSVIGNNEKLDLSRYWDVYKIIKLDYYDNDGIKKEDLIDSSIKGLVKGLGDKHSEYFTKKETEKFNEVLSGDFEGIGAVVEKNFIGIKLERILKGSPAKKAGLKAGDIAIKVNNIELKDLDLYEAVDKIKGKAGTKVILEIIRAGEKEILKIEVTRDKIKIPSVNDESFENGKIGYISINMFGDDTAREFKKALKKYKKSEGIIIDLRDNGGGYLQSATEILSELIEDDKTLVVTKYKNYFNNIKYPSINSGNIYDGKIVILINENSASASEITAGALHDYKKAILVGKKSYGKGSVQKPFYLSNGSMAKITIAKWFTPNDINIDKSGIEPDIEVDFKKEDYTPKEGEEEIFKPYDRQLETAKKVLKTFIENNAFQISIDKFNDNIKK